MSCSSKTSPSEESDLMYVDATNDKMYLLVDFDLDLSLPYSNLYEAAELLTLNQPFKAMALIKPILEHCSSNKELASIIIPLVIMTAKYQQITPSFEKWFECVKSFPKFKFTTKSLNNFHRIFIEELPLITSRHAGQISTFEFTGETDFKGQVKQTFITLNRKENSEIFAIVETGPEITNFPVSDLYLLDYKKLKDKANVTGFVQDYTNDRIWGKHMNIHNMVIEKLYALSSEISARAIVGQDVFSQFHAIMFTEASDLYLGDPTWQRDQNWHSTKMYYINKRLVILGADISGLFHIMLDTGFSAQAVIYPNFATARYNIDRESLRPSDIGKLAALTGQLPSAVEKLPTSISIGDVTFEDIIVRVSEHKFSADGAIAMNLGHRFFFKYFEEFRSDFENMESQFKLRQPAVD